MSDRLQKHLDKLIERTKEENSSTDVRFSLTFSKFNNRRIEYVRRKLKLTKQELLHDIIVTAIADIEVKLGLAEYDETIEQGTLKKEYGKAIASLKPISTFFKDKD